MSPFADHACLRERGALTADPHRPPYVKHGQYARYDRAELLAAVKDRRHG